MSTEILSIKDLGQTPAQTRASLNEDRVEQYRERMEAGDAFPPPVVFRDVDGALYLADGYHREEAKRQLDRARFVAVPMIECEVRQGDRLAAVLYGIEANRAHDKNGLYRSNRDKRRSVEVLFEVLKERDEEWSSRQMAELCGVHHDLVENVRKGLADSAGSAEPPKPRVGKDGKTRTPRKPSAGARTLSLLPQKDEASPAVSIEPTGTVTTPADAPKQGFTLTFESLDEASARFHLRELANRWNTSLEKAAVRAFREGYERLFADDESTESEDAAASEVPHTNGVAKASELPNLQAVLGGAA